MSHNDDAQDVISLALTIAPITRTQLALYCGASGDHNPIHVDPDAARAAGLPDVIAHGMLSMAFLGRMLTDAAGPTGVRRIAVRFGAMTNVGDAVSCTGQITGAAGGEATVALRAAVGDRTALTGSATIIQPGA